MRRTFLIAAVMGLCAPQSGWAQTATQIVHIQVHPINQIAVTGSPQLSVTTAAAGSMPSSAMTSANSFAVTTNQTNAKITASIASGMPTGVTLSVQLAAPSGALSLGMLPLGTTPVDLVTSISRVSVSGLTLTYRLDATPDAGVIADDSRVVTYTITGGA